MIRFGHISDTHLPGTPSNAFLDKVCREIRDPWDTLKDCLQELAKERVDFILHTGDVVHGGQEQDYEKVRGLFESYLPGVPVVFAPGNHDDRGMFWKQQNGVTELSEGEFVQDVRLACGVRVLVLDTLRKAAADAISERQVDWLEERLKEAYAGTTFLLMHHPPVWHDPIFAAPGSKRWERLIAESNIKAIFAGHTHQNLCTHYAGKPLYVADSLAVGMRSNQGQVQYHSRIGYSLCSTELISGVTVENRLLHPFVVTIKK